MTLFLILIAYLALMIFCGYRVGRDNYESAMTEIANQVRDEILKMCKSFEVMIGGFVTANKAIFELGLAFEENETIDNRSMTAL